MLLTYKQKRTEEINPTWNTPAHMPQRDAVADWKGASNVRPGRYEEITWTMYDGKLRSVSSLQEAIDPDGIEGFGQVVENRAC